MNTNCRSQNVDKLDESVTTPRLSVVMPVHNGAAFLEQSITAILNQTFSQFEFVIMDDGSTDESAMLLSKWASKDRRIRLISSKRRLGLAGSSNAVVSEARAPIVARMDCDDLCHPERLAKQYRVLEEFSDVVLVGTLSDGINSQDQLVRPRDRSRLLRRSQFPPFPHGSVMFRKSAYELAGGYRDECNGWEDQDLFVRFMRFGRIVTLPETLYRYRYHDRSTSLIVGSNGVPLRSAAALHSLGAMRLWAGESPNVFTKLLANRTDKFQWRTLPITFWAGWGALHSPSLRMFMRCVVRTRDQFAGLRIKDGRPYEWRAR